jgi:uncharacterized protein (TIGR03435 family)
MNTLLVATPLFPIAFGSAALAQSIPSERQLPAFEAATVRPTAPADLRGAQWSKPGGGMFAATNMTLELLTSLAYAVDAKQIKGAPGWFASKHFDINARAEQGVALTRDGLRPRLQQLLQERFHLKIRRDSVLAQGFALVVGKGGPRLTPTGGEEGPNFRVNVGPGKLQGKNWSMDFCALMLAAKMGAPVVDRTGLQ